MRLALAIVSCFIAALLVGFGIAQRTFLAGPDHVTAAVSTTSQATVTVIDGATLNAFDRSQTVKASGAETIFAAYGRSSDVLAWVGEASYNELSYDPESGELVSRLVTGEESSVPEPAGSDLWLADYTESKELSFTINVPEDISVIIVSDGVEPAPADVSLTWQLDNSTPFAMPLVIGGSVLLVLGLVFLLGAVHHVRRGRGPRRKPTRLPKVPKKPTYKPVKRGAAPPVTRGRRSARMVVGPTLLVGALLLSACTAEPVTTATGDTSAVPTSPAEPDSTLETPAVTEPQAKRIVTRIAELVAKADEDKDAALVATRMDGPALALRTANYTVRKVVADSPAPTVIPPSEVVLTLPQQNDSWPRTVFAVVQGEADETAAPVALVLIQDDPRSQYKVHYSISLEPGAVIPDVAPPSIGTNRLGADVKIFALEPGAIAAAYGDILMKDAESESFELFEAEGDTLRVAVGKAAKDARIAGIPSTAQLSFSTAQGEGQVVALATNDGGALVAVELAESETIKPVETGAAVNAPPDVAALLNKSLSTKGLTATYGDQLLFFVPPAAVGGKIVLLGYSQGLISAAELP